MNKKLKEYNKKTKPLWAKAYTYAEEGCQLEAIEEEMYL